MSVYETLRSAIVNKSQVTLEYGGHRRQCCPHVIGCTNGKELVLVFQFAGGSSSGLPAGGEWRCMSVDGITILSVTSGKWYTDGPHSKPQNCVEEVDVEVR